MKIKRTRSKVSSKLFRSSQLVKLCKTVVNSGGFVSAWTPYNLLKIHHRISKSIFIARKEWRAGSKGYIPARSGSECGCCVLISPSNKEKEYRKLTNCTSCFSQLYLRVFLDFQKIWSLFTCEKKEFYNNPTWSLPALFVYTLGLIWRKTQSCKNTLTGLLNMV